MRICGCVDGGGSGDDGGDRRGLGQERLPQQVAGAWKITRVLPARSGAACWTEKQAQPLVGSLLEYSQHNLRWQGGTVPLNGVTTRAVSSADLAEEAPAGEGRAALTLTDLGIRTRMRRR